MCITLSIGLRAAQFGEEEWREKNTIVFAGGHTVAADTSFTRPLFAVDKHSWGLTIEW